MMRELKIDGEPVARTIDPRRSSVWPVRADGLTTVTVGSHDLDAEVVADVAARETGARSIEVERVAAGPIALAAHQPSWSQFMVFGDVRVNRAGHMVAPEDGIVQPGAGPRHQGGETARSAAPADVVSAWRVQWADGRSWLLVVPGMLEGDDVLAFLARQHAEAFVLGRVDAGSFLADPDGPAPAGYRLSIAAAAPAAVANAH